MLLGADRKQQISDAIREATGKAGALVVAAIALGAAAVLLALATLVYAFRTRRAA